jgi:uncharacterized protein (TIGR02147 family)
MTVNVFAYTNFREFLKDVYDDRREKNESFSLRAFTKLVGFSSPNYMRMITSGERNLTDAGIKKVSAYLKFKKNASNFFTSLVYFNQAKTNEEKRKYFEKICYFKAFCEIKRIDHQSYQYLSKWYYPAIRELTLLKGFKEDPRWIAAKLHPSITPQQVKDALVLLKDLGFLQYDKRNRIKPADVNIRTDVEVVNLSLWNFHHEMIHQALEKLEQTEPDFRDMLSVTLALNHKGLKKIKTALYEFCEEITVDAAYSKDAEAVYQLNMQLFNMSEVPKTWKTSK